MDNELFYVTDDIAACGEVLALLDGGTTTLFDEPCGIEPELIGGYRVAPWGHDNLLPQHVMDKIERVEIIGANADLKTRTCYGCGPRLVKAVFSDKPEEMVKDGSGKLIGGKIVDKLEVFGGEVYDWFEGNDISQLVLEMLTDMVYFHNAFPLLLLDKDFVRIDHVVHREAVFSRWGVDAAGNIEKHLYSGKWDDNPGMDIVESYVVDERNAFADIRAQMMARRHRQMCFPVFMPSPGRPYYSYPSWYSIFRSGWYDQVAGIPALKKAILKHNLGIRHIIYIDKRYLAEKAQQEGIAPSDVKAIQEMKDRLIKKLSDAISGEENAGKALSATVEYDPFTKGLAKSIQIEKIDNSITSGEQLEDYETGANVIAYAMGVNSQLIGATPGKNSNSLSGSNQRELFLIQQAMSYATIDRAMRVFTVVKKINGWPAGFMIEIPMYEFVTLDKSKTGKVGTSKRFAE